MTFLYFFFVAFGVLLFFTATLFKLVDFLVWIVSEHKRRKRAKRRGGDVTEILARQIRFFDDKVDPRELIR